MERPQINIRISKDLKEEFYASCEKENLQPSVLIRSWIEEFVEVDKAKSKGLNSKYFLPRNII
ncbi:MAG TPA: hypothetical protein DEO65_08555 [Bacillus bacterium]|uniref:Uncharacterized protein n=1 Tax=Siminovitchia fordii TaxID=254759 RepID=A0ABQ4K6T5_9BACI|nr:hypothetical protein [Siminovitchia fordii]GIN20853.1 hypothetical protein J1TS3_19870 [Siminovitchia fordii]HBZ09911.1 hypothetical protein [Bacillus sp. (in: firmicutes)]